MHFLFDFSVDVRKNATTGKETRLINTPVSSRHMSEKDAMNLLVSHIATVSSKSKVDKMIIQIEISNNFIHSNEYVESNKSTCCKFCMK